LTKQTTQPEANILSKSPEKGAKKGKCRNAEIQKCKDANFKKAKNGKCIC